MKNNNINIHNIHSQDVNNMYHNLRKDNKLDFTNNSISTSKISNEEINNQIFSRKFNFTNKNNEFVDTRLLSNNEKNKMDFLNDTKSTNYSEEYNYRMSRLMPMGSNQRYPIIKNKEIMDFKPLNTRSSIKNENHNYSYQDVLKQFNKPQYSQHKTQQSINPQSQHKTQQLQYQFQPQLQKNLLNEQYQQNKLNNQYKQYQNQYTQHFNQ